MWFCCGFADIHAWPHSPPAFLPPSIWSCFVGLLFVYLSHCAVKSCPLNSWSYILLVFCSLTHLIALSTLALSTLALSLEHALLKMLMIGVGFRWRWRWCTTMDNQDSAHQSLFGWLWWSVYAEFLSVVPSFSLLKVHSNNDLPTVLPWRLSWSPCCRRSWVQARLWKQFNNWWQKWQWSWSCIQTSSHWARLWWE